YRGALRLPSKRTVKNALAAQLRAEALAERLQDPAAQRLGVLVGERALRRLEAEREGERLLPRRDRRLAVVAQEAHLAQLGSRRLARRLHEGARRPVLVHDDRDVLLHRR